MNTDACPSCGTEREFGNQTCQKCGTPLPYAPSEAAVGCVVCAAPIDAYTETCPECGETGYPALRPRRGKGWQGSPEAGSESE